MPTSNRNLAWTDVDASAKPERSFFFLDNMNSHPAVKRYKEKTFMLLDLKPGQIVLDLGSGTGEDAQELAKLTLPGKVIGVDISRQMVEEARKRNVVFRGLVSYQVQDALNLDFNDSTFDRCRVDRVLQHIARPADVLKEIKRVLKKDGLVVVSEPDWRTLVIDSADTFLARTVIDAICARIPNCQMGCLLAGLLVSAGFGELSVVADTLIIQSFSQADNVFGLRSACQQAMEEGKLSQTESAEFIGDLEKREKAGSFFVAMTGFAARARKS